MKEIRSTGFPFSNTHASSVQELNGTYLTDDIWHAIFLYLPLYSIFKLRCVSMVWLSILSNSIFMNKWYKLNSSLWTLILGSSVAKENPTARLNTGLPYPELNSQFIFHHESVSGLSFRFVNQKHELTNTNLYIIGSSNGLVLCTTDCSRQNNYYVCNPVNKRWISLPPPPRKQIIVHPGFTCESSLISTSFKVIRVSQDEGLFKIDIYTSDLGEWNFHDVIYPPGVRSGCSIYDNYVTCNGVFYWYQNVYNNVLAFSVDKINNHQTFCNEIRLIKLPDQEINNEHGYLNRFIKKKQMEVHQCLGDSEGSTCFAIFKQTERSLSVWVYEENWYLLYKDMEFSDMLAQMESSLIGVKSTVDLIRDVQVIGFSPVDKNVVMINYKNHIFAYNIRNGGYEQLSHPSPLRSNFPGPYWGILTFAWEPRPTILPPVAW